MHSWIAVAGAIGLSTLVAGAAPAQSDAAASAPIADAVSIDLAHPANVITPNEALGAAIDGMQRGEVKKILTPFNIEKMQSAGLRRTDR